MLLENEILIFVLLSKLDENDVFLDLFWVIILMIFFLEYSLLNDDVILIYGNVIIMIIFK